MYKVANTVLSLPVILVALCFMPVLGVILLLARMYICPYYKNYKFNITLAICGLLILVPKILEKFKLNIPYLNDILSNNIYKEISKHGKFIIIVGVILFLVTYIYRTTMESLKHAAIAAAAIQMGNEGRKEISENKKKIEVNEYEEEIKEFKKITEYHCPYCGGLTKSVKGVEKCKYCDREVEINENE